MYKHPTAYTEANDETSCIKEIGNNYSTPKYPNYEVNHLEFKKIGNDKVAALGLGTWRIGGGETPDYSKDIKEVQTLRYGIDLGLTHIDTAEHYGAGHSEEIVGKAIEPYDRRDLFITSKVWPNHLKYDQLLESMKASLKRLNLDYVDLYLVHWSNPEIPLEETMNALEHCIDEGYTRHIGVSNFSIELLNKATSYLKDNRLVANQVKYSLLEQSPSKRLHKYCIENDMLLTAYSPLGRGPLTKPGNKVLDELTVKYEKTQAQIALNWLISQEKVITIPKASNIQHIEENNGAISWKMSTEDQTRLAESFKNNFS